MDILSHLALGKLLRLRMVMVCFVGLYCVDFDLELTCLLIDCSNVELPEVLKASSFTPSCPYHGQSTLY